VRKLLTILSSAALLLSLAAPVAATPGNDRSGDKGFKGDNLPGKLAQKQVALKNKALGMVLKGQVKPKGENQVVEVAKGQFVELAQVGEDQILTLLAEFGDEEATHGHGTLGTIAHGGEAGPLHNEIPEPDRDIDNTTIWVDDFNQAHYDALLYDKGLVPSMANWYLKASDGRYSVDGHVGDWVQVPFNAAAYGSNYCGSNVCTRDVGRFLLDQAEAWYQAQLDSGMTPAEIDDFLSQFDIWDRYDFDHDGDFDEPDGYIDHYQSVHAGEGEETGGGAEGEDAIWSHRSYANAGFAVGGAGPTVGGEDNLAGGAPIGESSYWIGDYTIEPENGGVGVFGHEFGHDLDIPDLYDGGGNTGFGENSTAWWTMWSQGSYGTIDENGLGTYPVHMAAWEKFFLGWLNFEVAFAGRTSAHKVSAITANTKQAQAVFVVLPLKETTIDVGDPWSGSWFYHSGSGNDLDNTMTRSLTLGGGANVLSFDARYHIEPCWDYAYLQVSTNGGSSWTNVHTSASDDPALNVNAQNFGEGISGVSGHPVACDDNLNLTPSVVNVTADLSAYANSTIQVRFRYWTDGAAVGDGLGWDNLRVDGSLIDDAESADAGWTFDGFNRTDGTVTSLSEHYYLAEYRKYQGYDLALREGPYNFVDPQDTEGTPNLVEHFPYQDGLLIWYWDLSMPFGDQNTSEHPGSAYLVPIDTSPQIMHWTGSGDVARPRIQAYDATLGLSRTDAFTLHSAELGTLNVPARQQERTFDDSNSYWVASDPADATSNWKAGWNSVDNPHTGTVIRVQSISALGNFMQIVVNP
jgi:immune inhibitor A